MILTLSRKSDLSDLFRPPVPGFLPNPISDPPHDFSPFDPVLGTPHDFNLLPIHVTLTPSLMHNRIHHIRNTAIELASQFAFCKAEEDKTEEVEAGDSMPLANEEEDCPGLFSTALKVIEEQELMPRAHSFNCTSVKDGEAEVKIPWMPSNVQRHMTVGKIVSPFKDLCDLRSATVEEEAKGDKDLPYQSVRSDSLRSRTTSTLPQPTSDSSPALLATNNVL